MMESHKVKKRLKDKSDRATVQKVLDKKTMSIIEKLIKRSKILDLCGCVSTGKEANVYTCRASTDLFSKFVDSEEQRFVFAAIKIYQTSIMEFKSRGKYIENESRFQRFCKTNPRKLVKVWIEKEVRNLKRLNKVGIPSPKPIYLKRNILIMSLIGDHGAVAPRLKDAVLEDVKKTYYNCLELIKRMYIEANLIHADLSEYNILYYDSTVFVIDVGQSVERSHENGHDFLIMDINNINNFFKKRGVDVMNTGQIFEMVTSTTIPACVRNIELKEGIFIPVRIDDIASCEDISIFKAETNKVKSERKKPFRNPISKEEKKNFLKANKKIVKEHNRLRRAKKKYQKKKRKRSRNQSFCA